MAENFGDLILKGSALNLAETNLKINAGVTVGAGINIASKGCADFYFFEACTPGIGGSVNLGVHGQVNVAPKLKNPNGSEVTNQKLSIYNMLNMGSSSGRHQPNYKARQKQSNSLLNQDSRINPNGMTGNIRTRLVDYQALIDVNFKDYLANIETTAKKDQYLNVDIEFSNELYINKNPLWSQGFGQARLFCADL